MSSNRSTQTNQPKLLVPEGLKRQSILDGTLSAAAIVEYTRHHEVRREVLPHNDFRAAKDERRRSFHGESCGLRCAEIPHADVAVHGKLDPRGRDELPVAGVVVSGFSAPVDFLHAGASSRPRSLALGSGAWLRVRSKENSAAARLRAKPIATVTLARASAKRSSKSGLSKRPNSRCTS